MIYSLQNYLYKIDLFWNNPDYIWGYSIPYPADPLEGPRELESFRIRLENIWIEMARLCVLSPLPPFIFDINQYWITMNDVFV